jgi:hypothetical protein
MFFSPLVGGPRIKGSQFKRRRLEEQLHPVRCAAALDGAATAVAWLQEILQGMAFVVPHFLIGMSFAFDLRGSSIH